MPEIILPHNGNAYKFLTATSLICSIVNSKITRELDISNTLAKLCFVKFKLT